MELYYFWKHHCAPCAAAKPIVEKTAKELGVPVNWLDVRSPEGEAYIIPWNLMTVPTLVVVKDKHKIADVTGAELQNAPKLAKQLEKLKA
jgi:thiol-disulfide isomerase/thioredoxin